MASIRQSIRSSTTNKRPAASGLADGQIALNTASGTPAMFFKDNADNIVKVGPVHVGATAPNVSPAGSAGNSTGELWVDDSLTTNGLKYYSGSAFINLTPSGTTSAPGLVELATPAETQTGTDGIRAVTPSGLQSKVSDSTSTTSSTTIASATAVKSAYDLANAALPKSGGTITGEVVISPSGSVVFEGSSDDSFETTLAVVNPTADRTITFPNITGTVITTGDTGTVTSTMITDGTIVNADINASAAIALSKLGSGALPSGVTVASVNIVNGTIVDADINASAAIAGTKISPDFGGQDISTTGVVNAGAGTAAAPSVSVGTTDNGIYSPGTDQVAISTNAVQRVNFGTGGVVFNETGENYDFRIEGDTDGGLFFVDASTDRVGVGTTVPSQLFHISGPGIGATFAGQLISDSSERIRIGYRNGGPETGLTGAQIVQDTNVLHIASRDTINGAVVFNVGTAVAERARIDSSGNLLVGTTNTSPAVNSVAGARFLSSGQLEISQENSTALRINRYGSAPTGFVVDFRNAGTIVGTISTSASATAYNTSSDYRLKENVVPLTGAADRVNQLQVHRFNFITDPDTTVDGFIAHEAQAVVPECVTGSKDEVDEDGNPVYQGIDQSKLVPLLTAALQEALQKIEDMEARLDAANI